MVLVMVSTAVAMVLAMSFLAVQATSVNLSNNIRQAAHARAIAESGLAMTIRYINNTSTWQTGNSPGTWVNNQTFLGGSLTVKVVDGWDSNGDGVVEGDATQFVSTDAATITVTVTYKGASYTCQAVMMPKSQPLSSGILTSGSISADGDGTTIDSFDSGLGVYGGSNVGSQANVATDATAAGSVTVSSAAIVKGSVQVGSGANLGTAINSSGGTITGSQTALSNTIPLPVLTAPTGMPTSVGAVWYNSNDTIVISSNLHCDSFRISDNQKVQISGNVIVLCGGDVKIETGAHLEILNGGSLSFYFTGTFIDQTNAVNTVDGPNLTRLAFYNLGTSQMMFQTAGTLVGVIVSPNANVELQAGFQFSGAIIAQSATMNTGGQFHQDTRITSGTDPVNLGNTSGYSTRWAPPF